MKTFLRLPIFAVMCMTLLTACTPGADTDNSPTPRRRAYPRPRILTQEYVAPESLPLHIEINKGADTVCERRSDGSVWLTSGYPDYGATVYWTLTSAAMKDIREVINNRMERIARNVGDSRVEIEELSSESGFDAVIVKASEPVSTPLQFVASDKNRWVVSGAVWMSSPGSSADSLQPYLDALSRDITHALSSLSAH